MPRPSPQNRTFQVLAFFNPHTCGGVHVAALFADSLPVSAGEGNLRPRCPRKGWVLTGNSHPLVLFISCSREDLRGGRPALSLGGAARHSPPWGLFTGARRGQPQAAWAPLSQPPQASWSLGQNWILVYCALVLGSFTAHTEKPTSFQLPSKAPVNGLRGHLPVLNQKLLNSSVACPHWTRCGVPLLEGQISSFKGCQARHLSSSVGAPQIYTPPPGSTTA